MINKVILAVALAGPQKIGMMENLKKKNTIVNADSLFFIWTFLII